MVDPENEVYTRVASVLKKKFPGIRVASDSTYATEAFPFCEVIMIDNRPAARRSTNDSDPYSLCTFRVSVYSNKTTGRKSEAKAIASTVADWMSDHNFRRVSFGTAPNIDESIYRHVSLYEVVTDGTHFYRR